MALSALNTAASGLRVTQAAIDLVAQNVANAGTAGYVKRRLSTIETHVAGQGAGVRLGEVERVLSTVALRQLRLETSGAAYTDLRAGMARQLDSLYGTPGGATSLDGALNAFTESLQTLAAAPSSTTAKPAVVDAAKTLATRIGAIAEGVQSLRSDAERRLSADVSTASTLLSRIAELNTRSVQTGPGSNASLLDQRDQAINELSALMDVQTSQAQDGSITVRTGAGVTLVDHGTAAVLRFDGRSALAPQQGYTTDPASRGVGTITAAMPGGSQIDLVGTGAIGSGTIAAALEMRDTTLVQAQRQLDDLAGGLSRALSDRSVTGVAAASAGRDGFDIDLAGLQAGNAVTVRYTDGAGASRSILLVPTRGAAPATIDPRQTDDPTASVRKVDISGGPSTFAAAIGAALGAGFSVSDTPGAGAGTVRILDDGSAGAPTLNAVSAGITVMGTQAGVPQLPLFVDSGYGNTPFTGSFEGGSHLTGLAQRLVVNPAVSSNLSTLTLQSASTLPGDSSRPQFLYDALTGASRTFSASSGIGGISAPFAASVQQFAQRIIEVQGADAAGAGALDEGQQVALAGARSRFSGESGVSVDEEMAHLIQLQTAYSANARVLSAARDMLDTLLRI